MHRKLVDDIIEKGNPESMKCLKDIFIKLMDDMKIYDYDEYKDIEYKLYKTIYGEHLNEELAHKWVDGMQNKDGTVGAHWTYEQTSQYADGHNKWDWFATMNMMFSDYFNPKFDTQTYVTLANDFINDKDGHDGKVLCYYMKVVNKK